MALTRTSESHSRGATLRLRYPFHALHKTRWIVAFFRMWVREFLRLFNERVQVLFTTWLAVQHQSFLKGFCAYVETKSIFNIFLKDVCAKKIRPFRMDWGYWTLRLKIESLLHPCEITENASKLLLGRYHITNTFFEIGIITFSRFSCGSISLNNSWCILLSHGKSVSQRYSMDAVSTKSCKTRTLHSDQTQQNYLHTTALY